ncbi:beta-lactamase/transpeptidase-like protein [Rhizodiscina lignyota]|uniref:Beta-lactamase/transpeptidase-like protein n=1 Tax=Rhizodiscina lignyota TaxID=1504668 RepID=A0A9P4IDW0_9PEZI|nr:beta-lactamase/transpeptidase-like protein [Rhizodiscina lignyota]
MRQPEQVPSDVHESGVETQLPRQDVFGALVKEQREEQRPFTTDSVCWIASMTKLMTTVSAVQCVERGLIGLDDDVSERILPEFRDINVLEDMVDDGKGGQMPRLRKARGKITLRNLLTHCSGLSYEFMHARLMAWRQWDNQNRKATKTTEDRTEVSQAYRVPLVFDPETKWSYGYGIDWAGVIVERLTGFSLEQYMQKNIWTPLGMNDTTFRLMDRPDLKARICSMMTRDSEGRLVAEEDSTTPSPIRNVRDAGGGGCASTANDYIKLLISLLKNDEKLLKKSTVEYMFQPHLKDPSHLRKMHANPAAFGLAGNIPPGTKVDFGLGGILNMESLPWGRSAGSMQWGGYPNLFWWINPKDGICGCYFSQLIPPGDPESFEMYKKFETAVNESFKKETQKL